MSAAAVVRARIDADLKKEASAVLAGMGLSLSDAIRLMLVRVVSDQNLPFDIRVPNAATQAALRDVAEGRVERFASVTELMCSLSEDDDQS